MRDAWTLAIEAFSWMELQNLSEKLALSRTVKQLGITDAGAKGLAYRLVYETVRRKNSIDSFINQALKPRRVDEFDLGVRAFLRLYVYKIRMERQDGAYGEAVEIARTGRSILGWEKLQPVEKALGMLISLKKEKIYAGLADEERVALQTYHPSFFVKYCYKLFGRGEALKFLESSHVSLPIYIRTNTLKMAEDRIIETLENEGLRIEKVSGLNGTYEVIETKKPLASLPSFRRGLVSIEDKASSLAVEVAPPESGMTVFDVCAAPGTKTVHLALLMRNTGKIYSLDFSHRRIRAWKRNTALHGVENASPVITDARQPLPSSENADLVLLDPPCTNTGVFGRIPSAKWRLTSNSIPRMVEVQWQMLKNCAEKVKKGGFLVYSTSSVTVEENEMQIERFLRVFPEFGLVDAKPLVGLPGLRGLTKSQRLYPHMHKCNGGFIAKLRKEA